MKNILLVGCSGGIGNAVAKELIKRGYMVYGLDLMNKIEENNQFRFYSCNLTDEESICAAYEKIKKEVDELYAIINCAGIFIMDSLLEIPDEELKKIIDINVFGSMRIVKTFFPLLTKGSRILLTTSEVANLDPLPFNSLYAMSKSLLEKYAFSLRMEINMFGIKVITLRPGAIKTKLLDNTQTEVDKMCSKTKIHKETSKRFRKIMNSVESKTIEPEKLAKFIGKIVGKKRPRYHYKINNSKLLKLLSILPDHVQVGIITKILRG